MKNIFYTIISSIIINILISVNVFSLAPNTVTSKFHMDQESRWKFVDNMLTKPYLEGNEFQLNYFNIITDIRLKMPIQNGILYRGLLLEFDDIITILNEGMKIESTFVYRSGQNVLNFTKDPAFAFEKAIDAKDFIKKKIFAVVIIEIGGYKSNMFIESGRTHSTNQNIPIEYISNVWILDITEFTFIPLINNAPNKFPEKKTTEFISA